MPVSFPSNTQVWGIHKHHVHGEVAVDPNKLCHYHPMLASEVLPSLSCHDRQCSFVAAVFLSSPLALFNSHLAQVSNIPCFREVTINQIPEDYSTLAGRRLKQLTMLHHPLLDLYFPSYRSGLPLHRPLPSLAWSEIPLSRPGLPLAQPGILLPRL